MCVSGANSAAAWLLKAGDEALEVSVTTIFTEAACGPAYLLISERAAEMAPAILAGLFRRAAVLEPPGYQWMITKSTALPAMESTVLFGSASSPEAFTPSGQEPGVLSTAPIFTFGSTAFIAFA